MTSSSSTILGVEDKKQEAIRLLKEAAINTLRESKLLDEKEVDKSLENANITIKLAHHYDDKMLVYVDDYNAERIRKSCGNPASDYPGKAWPGIIICAPLNRNLLDYTKRNGNYKELVGKLHTFFMQLGVPVTKKTTDCYVLVKNEQELEILVNNLRKLKNSALSSNLNTSSAAPLTALSSNSLLSHNAAIERKNDADIKLVAVKLSALFESQCSLTMTLKDRYIGEFSPELPYESVEERAKLLSKSGLMIEALKSDVCLDGLVIIPAKIELRSSLVKILDIVSNNNIVLPSATAGQSCPPGGMQLS